MDVLVSEGIVLLISCDSNWPPRAKDNKINSVTWISQQMFENSKQSVNTSCSLIAISISLQYRLELNKITILLRAQ